MIIPSLPPKRCRAPDVDLKSGHMWEQPSAPQPPQSPLHLPVPQAVDQGVEQGGHCSVEDRNQFLLSLWSGFAGQHVGDQPWHVEGGDGSQVGGAGGEHLHPRPCGRHPQDCVEDAGVGHQDHQDGAQDVELSTADLQDVVGAGAGAGEVQEGGQLTEEVVNAPCPAESQPPCQHCVYQRGEEACSVHQHGHPVATCRGHEGGVAQWLAHGRIPVVSHHPQEKALADDKHKENMHLDKAAHKRDVACPKQEGLQGFGDDSRGKAEVHEGQVRQEEIHGCVQLGVSVDQHQQQQVSHHQ